MGGRKIRMGEHERGKESDKKIGDEEVRRRGKLRIIVREEDGKKRRRGRIRKNKRINKKKRRKKGRRRRKHMRRRS